MIHAKYIVIDGIDGGGKTSLFSWLKTVFPTGKFEYTREPGGTPLSEKIRPLLLQEPMSPYSEMCLFIAAREDTRKQVVAPALARGVHVISDRSDSSTFAYQLRGRRHEDLQDLFWKMSERIHPSPSLYIFLDLDPKVAAGRMEGRRADRFDTESIEFFRRVRRGFQDFAAHVQSPCQVVSAEHSPEMVAEEVRVLIQDHLRGE